MTTPTATIETWPRITSYLEERAPVSLSVDSVMRWSRRKFDPLPIHRWGTRHRPRVYAYAEELDRWLGRQQHDDKETP
jgi:hypothetical protein